MNTVFQFAELTEKQIDFLKSYTPEDDMFTSPDEMSEIENVLELNTCSSIDRLTEIRNSAVRLYSDLMKTEVPDGKHTTDRFWKYNNGMMSVTAVIDNYKYKYCL